jgi:hypothetical protein
VKGAHQYIRLFLSIVRKTGWLTDAAEVELVYRTMDMPSAMSINLVATADMKKPRRTLSIVVAAAVVMVVHEVEGGLE